MNQHPKRFFVPGKLYAVREQYCKQQLESNKYWFQTYWPNADAVWPIGTQRSVLAENP